MKRHCDVLILGGGLAGNLAAIMLAQRGVRPVVVDRGPPHDRSDAPAGRTINLALAARGLDALRAAGVMERIEPLLLPMTGRIVHDADGSTRTLPYGQRTSERIYSVSRAELNRVLYTIAAENYDIEFCFEHDCTGYDPATGAVTLIHNGTDHVWTSDFLLAADGAGSVIRRSLADHGSIQNSEELLDHGYKELSIPPAGDGRPVLADDGLHIWPRGGYMLIALPNTDGSFTATLFLPQSGANGFDAAAADVAGFFRPRFGDAAALIPDLAAQYRRNPVGVLGTVTCTPWRHVTSNHTCLLLGDAAHAIVPFHGQGINAGFEDCRELDRLLAESGLDWPGIAERFERIRKPNADAIARMALENYLEMRDGVRDPDFERRKALAFALENASDGRFVPRYSMVMFHPEIGYAEDERRGRIQQEILQRASAGDDDDIELALQLIEARL